MSLGKTVAVALVGLLLTASVAGANGVVAAERTVLDADYVTDSLAEGDFHETLREQLISQITESGGGGELLAGMDSESIAREAVSEAYVRGQVDANVERAYAFLHGDRADPDLAIDLRPLKDNVSAAVAAEIRNQSLGGLLAAVDADLSTENVTVNESVLNRLTANESSYQAVRADFREQVRDRILEAAVDQAMADTSNENLLLLVMDPADLAGTSEAEREQLVQDNEAEIRAELRQQIEDERGDEIDQNVDEALATMTEDIRDEGASVSTDQDVPANVTSAIADVQIAVVDGLAGEQSYDEFKTDLDAAKGDLADAIGAMVGQQIDEELPDSQPLTEEMSAEDRAQLDQAASMVQLLDTLALALPILALALIAGLYLLTRSLVRTTRTTGSTLLVVGAPAFVIAYWARGNLADMLATAGFEAGESQMGDVLIATADGVLGTIAAQSLLLAVVGLVLFGVAIAYGRGMFDEYLEDDGEEPAEGADEPPEEPAEET